VLDEGADGVIERRTEFLASREKPAVMVPVAVIEADETSACFTETPCQQQIQADADAVLLDGAVLVARLDVFLRQIERFPRLAQPDRDGLFLETAHPLHPSGSVATAADAVEAFRKGPSIVKP